MTIKDEGFFIFRGKNWQIGMLAMLVAVLAFLLCLVRIYNSASFSEPIQLLTSGDEVSSFFGTWNAMHGLDIYLDRFQSPYSLADFNWLFYETSAVWTRFWLKALSLNEAWIPTLVRFWTIAGCATGGTAAFLLFRDILRKQDAANSALALGISALLVWGPLYGFWSFTARPDVWAVSLEIIAISAFIALYRSHPVVSVILVSVIAYLGWSFKHTTVFGLGSVGLFLLFRRDFKLLALLTFSSVLFWVITFASMSTIYFETIFTIGHPLAYSLERALRNFTNFALKTTFLWLPLAGFVALVVSRERKIFDLKDDALLLALCGVGFTLPVEFALSFQTESSENYYFTPAFFMAFLFICLVSRTRFLSARTQTVITGLSSAGLILTALAILSVLFGLSGFLKPPGNQQLINAQKICLDSLQRPLYVNDRLMSLPWNTPNNTSYVRSYHYELERSLGRKFENDGIGGMIRDGKFATIAVPSKPAPDKVDGATLEGYHLLPEQCAGMSIFVRNP